MTFTGPAPPGTAPRAPWQLRMRATLWRLRGVRTFALVVCAAAIIARALAPPAVPVTHIAIADRDLPAGHLIAAGDLHTAELPASLAAGLGLLTAADAAGRLLIDVPAGGAIPATAVRGGAANAAIPAGRVGVVIRAANAAMSGVVGPWDRVDVLRAGAEPGAAAQRLATGAIVLPWPSGTSTSGPAGGGLGAKAGSAAGVDEQSVRAGGLLLAVTETESERIASLATFDDVTVVMVTRE